MFSLAVQKDGKIIVTGSFTTIGGQTRNYIARVTPANGMSDSFNPNPDDKVFSVAIQGDGKIIAGGYFLRIGGAARQKIARISAETGIADSFDPHAVDSVYTVSVQSDGKILVCGVFRDTVFSPTIGGQRRNFIARLDPETGLADSFDPNPDNQVYSVAVQADGKILAGGRFTSIGGLARSRLARLDPVTGVADSFNPAPENYVDFVTLQSDGKILTGGRFGIIGGQSRLYFARLSNDTAASENLSVTQPAIRWMQGGSTPQFSHVTFESSIDDLNSTVLGDANAQGNDWILTGLNLQTGQNTYIRAQGYYRTGNSNRSESIQKFVKNIFLVPGSTIIGTVTYGNAIGAPTPRFVSNVLLSGAGSVLVSAFSSFPNGTYSLSGFGSGAYTVTPSKTGGVNGAISSFDAGKIALHVAGLPNPQLNATQLLVADVSGNGTISSFDAGQVARYAAGVPGSGATGNWIFTPVRRNYASVSGNVTGEDFVALLMGEVSGNWMNTGARNQSQK